jgi:hypothetical protein
MVDCVRAGPVDGPSHPVSHRRDACLAPLSLRWKRCVRAEENITALGRGKERPPRRA